MGIFSTLQKNRKKVFHMKYLCFCFFFLFATTSFAKREPAPKTWTGYLMDKMCAKRKAADPEKKKSHTKICLIEDNCASSGYGVVVGKKFIPFDSKGNEIVANYLKTTPKESDFQIQVSGAMKGKKIAVADLQEKK
jgi:hypothetical protein